MRRFGRRGEVVGDELRVLVQSFASSPELVIVGAIDFSAALARIAREAGYRVTICDAREPFARSERFEGAATVVIDWPDRHLNRCRLGPRDAVLVFTHDPKFDEPALEAALDSGAGYVEPGGDALFKITEQGIVHVSFTGLRRRRWEQESINRLVEDLGKIDERFQIDTKRKSNRPEAPLESLAQESKRQEFLRVMQRLLETRTVG